MNNKNATTTPPTYSPWHENGRPADEIESPASPGDYLNRGRGRSDRRPDRDLDAAGAVLLQKERTMRI